MPELLHPAARAGLLPVDRDKYFLSEGGKTYWRQAPLHVSTRTSNGNEFRRGRHRCDVG